MISREELSERRFGGHGAWVLGFLCIAWLASFLSAFASPRGDGRLQDMATFLVIRPLECLVFVALAILILVYALRSTLPAVMQGLMRWTPVLLCAPLVDIFLRQGRGGDAYAGFVNGGQALTALLLGGFSLKPITSLGVIACVWLAAFIVGWTVWKLTSNRVRAVVSGYGMLVLSSAVLLVPSVIGWFGLPEQAKVFSASHLAVYRGFVFRITDSFWWRNVYERFPVALGADVEVAIQLSLGALAFAALALVVFSFAIRTLRLSTPQLVRYIGRESLLMSGTLVVFGFVFSLIQKNPWTWSLMNGVALLIFVLVLLSALLFVRGRNDVADLSMDETMNAAERPLVSGVLSPKTIEVVDPLFLGVSLVGGWLLGWPVFLCVLGFLVSLELYSSNAVRFKKWFPWNHVLLGSAGTALVLVGWFFGTQHAFVSRFPLGLAAGLLLSLALFSSLKGLQTLDAQREAGIETLPLWILKRRPEKEFPYWMAGIAAVTYLCLPLLTGWWRWLLLAIPIALGSVWFVLEKPYRERRVFLLFPLFLLVSLFLLGAHL